MKALKEAAFATLAGIIAGLLLGLGAGLQGPLW